MADEPKNSQQIIDNTTKALGQAVPLVVPQKTMKKKNRKGMLIGMLLFFIITLPVAIYYGFQQYTQITESRSKAVAPPRIRSCYSTLESCQSACQPAGTKMYYCRTDNHSCIQTTSNYTDTAACAANVRQYGQQPNTGACWASQADCQSACQAGQQMYICNTSTRACAGTTNLYTNVASCTENVRLYITYPNTDTCYTSLSSCNSACGPTATPTPTTRVIATNTPTTPPYATNTPTNTPTVYNTPAPGQCDASCDSDSNCESGLYCYLVTGVRRCRKDACPDRSDCSCPLAQATPIYVYQQYTQPGQPAQVVRVVYQPGQPTRTQLIAEAPIVVTPTAQPTPKVPVSGFFDAKAIVITIGSLLLLAIGLIF